MARGRLWWMARARRKIFTGDKQKVAMGSKREMVIYDTKNAFLMGGKRKVVQYFVDFSPESITIIVKFKNYNNYKFKNS